jgi:ketosteroid isomerase-like protein
MAGGHAPITEVFADDMVWRSKDTVTSKQYEDKQQFVDEVLAPFGAFAADVGRTIRSVRRRDTVIVLGTAKVSNDGAPYKNSYAVGDATAR